MVKNYSTLSQKIGQRLNPDNIAFEKSFSDELSSLSYSDILTYIRWSMKSVEPEYTRKSKEAGENVKSHLKKEITDAEYEYQGSVMTNTHIKGHSDIDLLIICDKFYTYDYKHVKIAIEDSNLRKTYPIVINKLEKVHNSSKYEGNKFDDLKRLRLESEKILSSKYTICDIDHPKAIKVHNKNLYRDVDIVVANWYDDVKSIVNNKGIYRGVQIFNKHEQIVENADYPFLSIDRINQRSRETKGRIKKMIRFMKNVKEDSEQEIKLSSFDINAICYDIPVSEYENEEPIRLVLVIYKQLKSIVNNKTHADKILSVDEKEPIFKDKPEKIDNLKKILVEIERICYDFLKVKSISIK